MTLYITFTGTSLTASAWILASAALIALFVRAYRNYKAMREECKDLWDELEQSIHEEAERPGYVPNDRYMNETKNQNHDTI